MAHKTEEIIGCIERITFQNPENGYTVAKIQIPKRSDLTCIVGTMPEVQAGETVKCSGTWKHHLVHGWQFEVEQYCTQIPADVEGIKKYLGSGLIKGIGPVYAERITDKFGSETLNIIDLTPEMLLEIPGIGKVRLDKIRTCWDDQKSIRDVMVYLQKYGISPSFAQRIFKTYGKESIRVITENPYRLASDIFGIGFKSADKVANKIGISKESPQRIQAGIEFVLWELANDGHTCFPLVEFLKEAQSLLEVPEALISQELQTAEKEDRIKLAKLEEAVAKPQMEAKAAQIACPQADMSVCSEIVPMAKTSNLSPSLHFATISEGKDFIWLKKLFLSEVGVSRELWRIKKGPSILREIPIEKAIEWVQEKLKIQLAQNQKKAVAKVFSEKFHIITGGPGTGKSTITHAILTIMQKLTGRILLAAPTGRAAKRMTEITGHKAQTIHSLLEYDFRKGGFKKNRENPLVCDFMIVDESSMIDTLLMYSLLKALPDSCRLVLVGDINQLPSVGPGNVLKDIIQSRMFSVTSLNEIFRQAAGSAIISNAHRIHQGIFPDVTNKANGDFFFIEQEDPEKILAEIIELVSNRLPTKYGFDQMKDIQVLAPMKKGVIGIDPLNQTLQEALNQSPHSMMRGGRKFSQGDKVMQIRNNYQKEVFNGDIGWIRKIDLFEQEMLIEFDDRLVKYEFSEIDEIVLAYAASIHKYQGSECVCVIIPIHTTHFMMLRRNLLYTGVTRGKKMVILIGTKKALAIAVRNDDVKTRYTSLKYALTGKIHEA